MPHTCVITDLNISNANRQVHHLHVPHAWTSGGGRISPTWAGQTNMSNKQAKQTCQTNMRNKRAKSPTRRQFC